MVKTLHKGDYNDDNDDDNNIELVLGFSDWPQDNKFFNL
jgi:hypothetical protein